MDLDTHRMNEQGRKNANASSSPLLLPIDDRFRKNWEFHVLDSPNNYTFRSNYSIEYDPSVNRSLTTSGYLVNDPDSWSGGQIHGTGILVKSVYQDALGDSRASNETGNCLVEDSELPLFRCRYEVDHPLSPFTVYVRHFSDSDTIMIMAFDNETALSYISGEFESVPFHDASDWLVAAR